MDVIVTGTAVASSILQHPGDTLADSVAAVAGFDPAALLGGRGFRYKDRSTLLSMLAATRALTDASLLDAGGPERALTVAGQSIGVVASSNLGNLDTVCRTVDKIASRSVVGTSPMDLPNASSNVIASSIAVMFGLRGPNIMVCNGNSSGLDAVWLAGTLIASGRADRVVVVGTEPVNDVVQQLLGIPAGQLFDGAAALVLEARAAAAARGTTPRARLGRYARRARVDGSILRALGNHSRPGMWLAGTIAAEHMPIDNLPRRDLEATLGLASGALGVLQVVAGVQWLRDGGPGPVLATAGSPEDGVASLLLTDVRAAT